MPEPAVALLLQLLDEGYDRKSWHGPNLRGGLRRVGPEVAAFRPAPERRNIWEHVVHAAYWKYTVRRRVTGEARGSFPLKGSNWFVRPDPAVHPGDWDRAWAADLALLGECHRGLREAVAGLCDDMLGTIPPGAKLTFQKAITGIAFHDVYHAGQIALLKRLAAGAANGAGRGVD